MTNEPIPYIVTTTKTSIITMATTPERAVAAVMDQDVIGTADVQNGFFADDQNHDEKNQQVAKEQKVISRVLPIESSFEAEAIGRRVALDAAIGKDGFGTGDEAFVHPPQTAGGWHGPAFAESLENNGFALGANPGTVQLNQITRRKSFATFHTNEA